MASDAQRIRFEPGDSLAAVKGRLYGLRGKRALVILPDESTLFQRRLNLVLLQREAHRQGAQLALVSSDDIVAAHAAALNISCFESVHASEKASWKRGRQKVFLPRYQKPRPYEAEDLKALVSRLPARDRRPSPWQRLLTLGLLIGLIGVVLIVMLPSASVEISPRLDPIGVSVDIIADAAVDRVAADQALIPASLHRATVETRAALPTSGIRQLNALAARGIVSFSNLTEAQIRVPADTILSANPADPILFRTVVDVTVPAGVDSKASAPFVAMARFGGPGGNLPAGAINTIVGPLAARLTVSNPAPAAGGELRTVSIVAEADRQHLLDIARAQLQALAYEAITRDLSETQVVVIETIAIDEERKDWTSFSAEAGVMADELTLELRAVVAAMVIDDRYARQLALAKLQEKIGAESAIRPDSLVYKRGAIRRLGSTNRVAFTASLEGASEAQVDLYALRQALAGHSLDDARRILSERDELSASAKPVISIQPEAFARMPLLALRIDIRSRRQE